jgi:hypothetical protein
MLPAELVDHRHQDRQERGLRADDAQRPGDRIGRFARLFQGALQRGQRRLRGLEEALAFVGQ